MTDKPTVSRMIPVGVLLGNDWRVWDGHHRICAAALIGGGVLVPVELAPGIVSEVDDE